MTAETQAMALLNAICEDSLDVPLSHVDDLEADSVLGEYEQSAKFKELRDLVAELVARAERYREALAEIAAKPCRFKYAEDGNYNSCREDWPEEPDSWCATCVARGALDAGSGGGTEE